MEIITEELAAISNKYGDDRRSEIVGDASSLDVEDLIPDEEMVITVSREGYVKRTEVDTYRAQRRGGRGLQGMGTKEEDWVEHLFVASAHEYLMIFHPVGSVPLVEGMAGPAVRPALPWQTDREPPEHRSRR